MKEEIASSSVDYSACEVKREYTIHVKLAMNMPENKYTCICRITCSVSEDSTAQKKGFRCYK